MNFYMAVQVLALLHVLFLSHRGGDIIQICLLCITVELDLIVTD